MRYLWKITALMLILFCITGCKHADKTAEVPPSEEASDVLAEMPNESPIEGPSAPAAIRENRSDSIPLETTLISYEEAASMVHDQRDDELLKVFVAPLELGCPYPQSYMIDSDLLLTAPEMLDYETAEELNTQQLMKYLFLFINMRWTQEWNTYEMLEKRWFRTWEDLGEAPADAIMEGCFVLPMVDVRSILDQHLSGYELDPTEIPSYEIETDTIRLSSISGIGGQRWMRIVESTADDLSQTIHLTVEIYCENYTELIDTRDYTICLADNGCRYTSILTRDSVGRESVPPTPTGDWDPTTPITTEECVLSNGIHMNMTYQEVMEILGEIPDAPDTPCGEYVNISANNISFGFSAHPDGSYRLNHMNITEDCSDITFFRDIGPGQHITEVFAKMPAWDTELKQWATQTIYDYGDHKCTLSYIALSYYGMRIQTPDVSADIVFSRLETKVKWIDVYAK